MKLLIDIDPRKVRLIIEPALICKKTYVFNNLDSCIMLLQENIENGELKNGK